MVRVVVAGQLPRVARNAPLHLFSASPELVGFGQTTYRQHSATTSRLLRELFEGFREEGFTMTYTMEDFNRQYTKKYFAQLTPEEQREALELLSPERRREVLQALTPEQRREVLRSLPPEELLAALSAEQIREYLDQLNAARPEQRRKSRRKK
ncbi:MAG: magnesium transporter MgtE N-terminal domain-containing protein [Gemmataceae bacterium]